MTNRASFLRRTILALAALAVGHFVSGAEPVISEFMASNRSTLADADGAYSDWIELHNPAATAVDLGGWYLTDSAVSLAKWRIPTVTIPAGGYLIVFASGKNRASSGAELHTNFALSAGGEYLALVKPDGATVAFEYAGRYPAQTDDVSYGVLVSADGSLSTPTYLSVTSPGRANAVTGGTAPAERVTFSRPSGPFTTDFALQLSGAGSGQVIRYELVSLNSGGETTPEPTRDSPEYSEPLEVRGSMMVRAAVFSSDGQTRGAVATAYFAKISASLSSFATQLPVVVLDNLGVGPLVRDGIDHPAWMYVYGARTSATPVFGSNPELVTPLTATVRGSSSADFPKKGYNIKLADANGGGERLALLGLPAHEKWALIAPWKYDPGFVNNSFIYTLSNCLGRWAPRTSLAEVFFNADGDSVEADDYAGIYVLTDRIEVGPSRVAVTPLAPTDVTSPAVTGGYVMKIDVADADEFGWKTRRGIPEAAESSIVLVAPKADDIAPAQRAYLVDYVQQMEDALISDRDSGFAQRTYLDYIDRASWVDHHILNTFAANPDALVRSAYFTKNRDSRLQAGPVWDFDRAFGSYEDERSFRWDVWSGIGAADVWQTGWWGVIARDPEFQQEWVDRWQTLRATILSNGSLLDLVATLSSPLAAAAARDAAKWPDNASPYGSFGAQVDRLKGWVTLRAQWIDGQFAAPPGMREQNGSLVFTPPAGAKLVYTTDGSDPRALGGEIAPNAIVTVDALSVPAGTNIHVRSYREDLKGVFPGSPWSSAAGGASSSPLTPVARLVNLSTRAIIGSGESTVVTGVVVADSTAKNYLFRAIGPGLAAFVATGVAPDPQLRVLSATGAQLYLNNGWQEGPDAALIPEYSRAVGAFPLAEGSRDSAVVSRLPAGSYTVEISSSPGKSGVGLAELYELDGRGRTVNVSSRAYVRADAGMMVGGLVVQGPAYKRVLIRAVGPGLTALGFSSALADPVLTIYSGANTVAANDRWEAGANRDAIRAAGKMAGAFPLAANSEDAAILITLPPGAYTAEVKGKNGTEGIALLEFYEIP